MFIIKPDYYDKFQCLADQCEDTCCAGWQIMIDEEALDSYRNVEGEFGERLKDSIDWEEGAFHQDTEKRCAFLNENNLCDLYTALGECALCRTCTNYPRHIEEFENVREYTLSVSCPEVARILFSKMDAVTFTEEETKEEEEFEEGFDVLLYSVLADGRDVMYRILQNRSLSVSLRARIIWEMASRMQEYYDEGMLFSCDEIFEACESHEIRTELDKDLREWHKDAEQVFENALSYYKCLYKLELLHEDWDMLMEETASVLFAGDSKGYAQLHQEFEKWQAEHLPEYDVWMEQLMVYFISTYFCGAVYDECIDSKVKMAVISTFYIHEMLTARWYLNENVLDMEDVILVAYRYSRELEHSDQNLVLLEDLLDQIQ